MTPPDDPSPGSPGRLPTQRTKKEVLRILRRAGFPPETIRSVNEEFPDVIDSDRDANALARYGISLGQLEERFGASP